MLERATACLKAGARESLKCAQQAPRSKRRLHSTFWAHGAGGLDLPPWAVSMLPMPTDLPLKHDNIKQKASTGSGSSFALPQEGVFLDFLYPPQALAWLHRTNGQCWERWERRNARRLPEGFIQASRGYSSRSYGKSATTATRRKEKHEDENKDPLQGVSSLTGKGDSLIQHARGDEDLYDEQGTDEHIPANVLIRREPSDGQNSSDAALDSDEFADTPGELAEAGVEEHPDNPLKALRDLVASRRVARGTDPTSRAWTLYNLLKDDDREDAHLKSWLLAYFAAKGNDVADAHCISLYYAFLK